MAIKFTCECGKRFKGNNELIGRLAVCPSCRREFVIQVPQVREPDVPLDPPEQSSTMEVSTGESQPAQEEPKSASRPFWKDPIVIVGATVPTLILTAFFGYLTWPRSEKAVIRDSTKIDNVTKVEAVAKIPDTAITKVEAVAETPDTAITKVEAVAKTPDTAISNTIGMKLILIPAGEFGMGSPVDDDEALEWETPWHYVRITRPFYLAANEVTRGQFRTFVDETGYVTEAEKDGRGGTGWNAQISKRQAHARYTWSNTGFDQTDDHPVVNVSWSDALVFANWLSHKEGTSYRLPTEAEWEYACRAGTTTFYSMGNDPEGLAAVGNVKDATATEKFGGLPGSEVKAHDGFAFTSPVGHFQPNRFGLYDMHGNVAEWCADRFSTEFFAVSRPDDPIGPDSGTSRSIRGGSWEHDYSFARSANRNGQSPSSCSDDIGFRLARNIGVSSKSLVHAEDIGQPTVVGYLTQNAMARSTSELAKVKSSEERIIMAILSNENIL